ncbi:hypothetical protein MSLAZ_2082 [Methanosarcina lacustris Z-7289]|uniref:Uncharacterized protein n=1 Tax=Methanosarcina lacustris Z-7289 TaxID=1434111 RepID=A0A0E3S8C1_9EURY|nr:hypothetical protein MSLAZ_2082 [Methanosarcina lacustris Z-7289]
MDEKYVSILVLLEAVFQPDDWEIWMQNHPNVSILVLLEAVFQPSEDGNCILTIKGFQSLFCWKLFFNRRF